jgi:hypothetical protein
LGIDILVREVDIVAAGDLGLELVVDQILDDLPRGGSCGWPAG